jgi:hypothetical protein
MKKIIVLFLLILIMCVSFEGFAESKNYQEFKLSTKKLVDIKEKTTIEFIREFKGMIGTILGTILGGIIGLIPFFTRRCGKIELFLNKDNCEIAFFYNKGNQGNDTKIEKTDQINNKTYLKYSFEIQLFNDTEIPKILRNIKVKFYDNKEEKFATTQPRSCKNYVKSNNYLQILENKNFFTTANLSPKKINTYNIEGLIKTETFAKEKGKIINGYKVYFEVEDKKGNERKKLIFDSERENDNKFIVNNTLKA